MYSNNRSNLREIPSRGRLYQKLKWNLHVTDADFEYVPFYKIVQDISPKHVTEVKK